MGRCWLCNTKPLELNQIRAPLWLTQLKMHPTNNKLAAVDVFIIALLSFAFVVLVSGVVLIIVDVLRCCYYAEERDEEEGKLSESESLIPNGCK